MAPPVLLGTTIFTGLLGYDCDQAEGSIVMVRREAAKHWNIFFIAGSASSGGARTPLSKRWGVSLYDIIVGCGHYNGNNSARAFHSGNGQGDLHIYLANLYPVVQHQSGNPLELASVVADQG